MEQELILGRYRWLATQGEGAFARVDICWDTRIQRRVAIKRIPLQADVTGVLPGLAEARTGAMLSHPAIVSVLDFEVENDEALLIMEAIEGPTLAELIDAAPNHMLSLDVAAAVAAAMADALDFAHENQVLHLDIKPENILIDRAGRVRVSDFGVSELADANGFGAAVGGTIGYMPPEQMRAEGLDQRCDEFAFAAVLYELLCGESPFKAHTLAESEDAMYRFELAAPSQLRSDCAPELDEALFTALQPEREMRYLTVLDFLDALEPWLGSEKAGIAELRELAQPSDEPSVDGNSYGWMWLDAADTCGPRSLVRVLAFVLAALVVGPTVWQAAYAGNAAGMPITLGVTLVMGLFAAAFPCGGSVAALCVAAIAGFASMTGGAFPLSLPLSALAVCAVAWLVSALLVVTARARRTRVAHVSLCVVAAVVPVCAAVLADSAAGTAELAQVLVPVMASVALVCVAGASS